MRTLVAGLLGFLLVGFCFYGGGLALLVHPEEVQEASCDAFLWRPKARWVKLSGCRLAVDELLVANADGIERFSDRANGISRALYARPPVWTELYVPVMTGLPEDQRAVRVMYRLADRDVLAWVNEVEKADEAQRKRLVDNPAMLLRVASPGLLIGHAQRGPSADALQEALGTRAQPGLLVVEPGPLPQFEFPVPAFAAGLLGGALLVWALTRALGHTPGAGTHVDTTDVSGVPLPLGELEAMRREEAARTSKGPPE